MGEREVRRLLAKRLHLEFQMFKYNTLMKSKQEIYDSSYQIEMMAAIYEIIIEQIESIGEETIGHLLWWNSSILQFLYDEWLSKDDSSYEELKAHVGMELGIGHSSGNIRREDAVDGARIYKAA